MGVFESDEQKRVVMRWAANLWDALLVFEELAPANSDIDHVLKAALWPENPFCREALVGAREHAFQDFSEDTLQDLSDASRAFDVKPVEDTHRCINTKQRLNINKKVSHSMRWHAVMHSGVLEVMDRSQPHVTDEDVRAATRDSESRVLRYLLEGVFIGPRSVC